MLLDEPTSRVSDHGLSPGGWRRVKLIVGGVVQDFLWFADLSQPVWLRSDLPRSDLPRAGALRPHRPDLICRDLTCSDLIKIPSDRLYGTPQGFREAGASRLVRRRFREPSKKFWFRPVGYLQKGSAPGPLRAVAYFHTGSQGTTKNIMVWAIPYLQEGSEPGRIRAVAYLHTGSQEPSKTLWFWPFHTFKKGLRQGAFGLWHTFTPEARNHQKHYGFNFSRLRQTGRGIPSYLHTYGDLKEGKDLTF